MPHDNPERPGGRIFDITKPGKTPAGPISRPIIVSDRSAHHDPMVHARPEIPSSPPLSNAVTEAVSKPEELVTETVAASHELHAEVPAEPSTAPIPGEAPTANTSYGQGHFEHHDEHEHPPIPSPNTLISPAPVEPTASTLPPSHEAPEHSSAPIKRRHRSRIKPLVVILLVLILAIVAADLLLDAGVVKSYVKPPVQIFHKRK